jgi:hypothetical protein
MNIESNKVRTLEVWTQNGRRIAVEQGAWSTRLEVFDKDGVLVDFSDSISLDLDGVKVGEALRWHDYTDGRPHCTTSPVVQARVTFQ